MNKEDQLYFDPKTYTLVRKLKFVCRKCRKDSSIVFADKKKVEVNYYILFQTKKLRKILKVVAKKSLNKTEDYKV